MQSRLLVNILLLALVVFLGVIIFNTSNEDADAENILTTKKPGDVSNITISHNDRIIKIVRNQNGWFLTEPVAITANDFRIKTILNLLTSVSYAKYPVGSLDLDKYGLKNPTTSITLDNITIDFGIVNPINSYRYVKVGNDIKLIDDHHYPLLSSQIGTLVSRKLLPMNNQINKLVLPEQTLALNTEDKWTSTKEISTDAIVETINHWKTTEAFGVHDYIERKSLGTIEAYIDNQYEPTRFVITDVDPWLIIARPDLHLEYHFNIELYDALLRPGAEKKLPDEFSEQSQSVPEDTFMKAIKKQAN